MDRSEVAPALDPAVVEFIHGGVAVGVATRDDDLRPEFARRWGPAVSADGRSLRSCVSASEGSPLRANLERNGALAVGFSPPTIARAVQVKGIATVIGEPEAADLERVERHVRSFVGEAERVGAPVELSDGWLIRLPARVTKGHDADAEARKVAIPHQQPRHGLRRHNL